MASTGSLKNAGFITLETGKTEWEKFADLQYLIEFETTALLDIDEGDHNKKGRVNLRINTILSPERFKNKSTISVEGHVPKKVSLGMLRAKQYLIDSLNEKIWVFFGYIQNANVKTYLLIMYYETIGIYTYAIKPKDEEVKDFFGKNSFNPQNN